MREIAWIRAALKDFRKFPKAVQDRMLDALAVASFGQKADLAKPMEHLGSGVMEIALRYRSNAYRVVYAVQVGDAIWVVHAFQKKSRSGIATPKSEIDLIKARLKQVREIGS